MTDPDRLAEIKAKIRNFDGEPRRVSDWLVGEVERLREQEALAVELGDLLPKAYLERDRLRGLLARLEWPETIPGAGQWHTCPVCSNHRDQGHDPDCWLAAELKG